MSSVRARLNKIWPRGKKFTYEALVVALKKKKKNFKLATNLLDFTSILKTFFRSGKLLGKFQEFKTLYEP